MFYFLQNRSQTEHCSSPTIYLQDSSFFLINEFRWNSAFSSKVCKFLYRLYRSNLFHHLRNFTKSLFSNCDLPNNEEVYSSRFKNVLEITLGEKKFTTQTNFIVRSSKAIKVSKLCKKDLCFPEIYSLPEESLNYIESRLILLYT